MSPALKLEPDDSKPTAALIVGWLKLYWRDDRLNELRFIKFRERSGSRAVNFARRYKPGQEREATRDILAHSGRCAAIYYVANGVRTDAPTIGSTRPDTGKKVLGADATDIPGRACLYADFDPIRAADAPKECSSTDAEKAAAWEHLNLALAGLLDAGFPEPYIDDSGNGYHLSWDVDLSADEESTALVRATLAGLAARFVHPGSKVDTKVFDLPRLRKVPGSLSMKGQPTAERPHRFARNLSAPKARPLLTVDQLRMVAAWATTESKPATIPFDMDAAVEAKRLQSAARPPGPVRSGRVGRDVGDGVRAYLRKRPPAVTGQNGHDHTFETMCLVVSGFDLYGSSTEAILSYFGEWNAQCDPPWSERELMHKIAEAKKAAPRQEVGRFLKEQPGRDARGRGSVGSVSIPKGGHTIPGGGSVGSVSGPQGAHSFPRGGSVGSVSSPGEVPADSGGPPEWGTPLPLETELLAVPAFPPRLIPEPLRPWIMDIKERMGCPVEYAIIPAMVGLGSLLGRNVTIRPKEHDDWTVTANLWGMLVGPPGWKKSPPVEEALKPIKRFDMEALDDFKEAEKARSEDEQITAALAVANKSELEKLAKKGQKDREILRGVLRRGEEQLPESQPCKRRILNDCTLERAIEILAENPRGQLQFRDELIGFLKSLDRQGRESDRGFYLEGYNGTGSYNSDRIGRGRKYVHGVCLSLLGTIQPGPLTRYLRDGGIGAQDGFVQRFQMAVYPDAPGEYVHVDRWPDADAKARATEVYRWIDGLDPASLGLEYDPDKRLHYVRLDAAAQVTFNAWLVALENRLLVGGLGTTMAAHLAKFRGLLPKLALVIHAVDCVGCQPMPRVTDTAVRMAAAWCELLEGHARRIYQMASEGDPEAAETLSHRLRKSLPNPFTFREVQRKGWAGLTDMESVRNAIGILEDRNWVKVIDRQAGEFGGRPTSDIFINPAVRGSEDDR